MGGYRDLMSRDDVAAYILQRIAEEETQARRRLRPGWRWGKHRAAYTLVELSAARHTLSLHSGANDPSECRARTVPGEPCAELKMLARRWARCADFRPEWR